MEDRRQVADGCYQPPALDDLALIAAIDGEASPEVMTHLRTCASCAARAQHFASIQGLLRERFFRMFCPSTDELIAYHSGSISGAQHDTITAHLRECPHCSREMRLLKHITSDPVTGRSPPVFWPFIESTIMPESQADSNPPAVTQIRRVIAKLLHIEPQVALVDIYGAARGPARTDQYAYHAENLQIVIDVHRLANRNDRRVLTGSLFLDDDLPQGRWRASAYSVDNNQLIKTADLDNLGNFVLDDLSPGSYRLSLYLPDREVVIEAIHL